MLRLEPDKFDFRIAYQPGQPQTLAEWQVETGSLIVANGGYFTEDYTATGLIAVAGETSGVSYEGFGGMFAITEAGPALRWLVERPYIPGESLIYALQSFPVLVKPGGTPGFSDEDGRPVSTFGRSSPVGFHP